jgi:hypothetical protein
MATPTNQMDGAIDNGNGNGADGQGTTCTANSVAVVSQSRSQQHRKKNAGGGRGNSKSFTTEEKLFFLNIMKDILPTDGNEWDEVLHRHNEKFASMNRDVPKLRRKFAALYRVKIPSGDPHMPDDVRLAKHVRHLITAKNNISCGDEDIIDIANDDDDDNEMDESNGEFARPNTRDLDDDLVLEITSTGAPSPAPSTASASARMSSTASMSSIEANGAAAAMMQAGKRTPRRSTSAPINGLSELLQLHMTAMSEARQRHEQYMTEERERRQQEREDRREEHRQWMEALSSIAKAYFESSHNKS